MSDQSNEEQGTPSWESMLRQTMDGHAKQAAKARLDVSKLEEHLAVRRQHFEVHAAAAEALTRVWERFASEAEDDPNPDVWKPASRAYDEDEAVGERIARNVRRGVTAREAS